MDDAALEWDGVRIDLSHVHESARLPMIRAAQAWMKRGERPPILTITSDGVDVSTQPELWPAWTTRNRGLGRYEWVGDPV